jgi:hypothetical protein
MNKALKEFLIVLGVFFGIVLLFFTLTKVGEKLHYFRFYQNAEREFHMPGVSDNLVQQGVEYVEEENVFLICGYMSDGTASRVYVISETGEVQSITKLQNEDGSDYTGHTGGIEYYGNCVYITEGSGEKGYDGGLDVFPLDKILSGEESVHKIGRVKTYNNPAYCHIYKGYIFVGEFYRKSKYETLDSHRMKTPAGDDNTALITVFKLDDSPFHISGAPVAGISTTDEAQGMCMIGDQQIVLSTSWGLAASHLCFYDMEKVTAFDEPRTIDGNTFPVYHLDSASLVKNVKAPPMAEEIIYKDEKLFIICESASNKYIYGKFMSGNYLYSYHYELPN